MRVTGLIGYGNEEDDSSPIPEETIGRVVGRSPFDFIASDLRMSLAMALYDVMGKHLGVPAYKLIGQKVRDAVPAAAWTRRARRTSSGRRSGAPQPRAIASSRCTAARSTT